MSATFRVFVPIALSQWCKQCIPATWTEVHPEPAAFADRVVKVHFEALVSLPAQDVPLVDLAFGLRDYTVKVFTEYMDMEAPASPTARYNYDLGTRCTSYLRKLCLSLGLPMILYDPKGYYDYAAELGFLDAIRGRPGDTANWLVYADWLEDQDNAIDARRAAVIRGWHDTKVKLYDVVVRRTLGQATAVKDHIGVVFLPGEHYVDEVAQIKPGRKLIYGIGEHP